MVGLRINFAFVYRCFNLNVATREKGIALETVPINSWKTLKRQ